ncbi:hypothetical protein [Sphingobium sp.]|uniref:hypothetical protein n=1 Tax=Sphingobium sp. TaxID=1912891 RepID=UPI002CAD1BD4|nr:hypothetical protein [Sphingobium sp.]HUD91472.1 hypothetical protein [Sphingobium sp.]
MKSEYEKQSEFDERRTKMDPVLNPFGQLIVCQSVDDNDDAPFNYNAESESFTGSFKFRLLADLDFKKTGSYQSKTRMGVRASVESFVDFSYIVDSSAAFDEKNLPCAKVNYNSVTYSVQIDHKSAPL